MALTDVDHERAVIFSLGLLLLPLARFLGGRLELFFGQRALLFAHRREWLDLPLNERHHASGEKRWDGEHETHEEAGGEAGHMLEHGVVLNRLLDRLEHVALAVDHDPLLQHAFEARLTRAVPGPKALECELHGVVVELGVHLLLHSFGAHEPVDRVLKIGDRDAWHFFVPGAVAVVPVLGGLGGLGGRENAVLVLQLVMVLLYLLLSVAQLLGLGVPEPIARD
mmetsp:Transcript_105716/g.305696  ORF Transcript_105716/g.305696 Transcript_105716/m.305696 type:complete len:224 (+) Transcript_105716:327-998(+)